MPQYKFNYFNVRGKGEVCRILLSLAGADWEDVRLDFGDSWQAVKESKSTNYMASYAAFYIYVHLYCFHGMDEYFNIL